MSSPKRLTLEMLRDRASSLHPFWMFDWDGSLVDLAPRPDAIVVPPQLLEDLRSLPRINEGRVAIISGRSLADLEHWIPLSDVWLIGNHGAEWRIGGRYGTVDLPPRVKEALSRVRSGLSELTIQFPNSALEDKAWTLSFHVRGLDHAARQSAGEAVRSIVAPHSTLSVRPADACLEIRPKHGPTKGDGVRRLLEAAPNTTPFTFGDDWTDEDAFYAANEIPMGLTVVVGLRRPTSAQYEISSPARLRSLLHDVIWL